VFLKGYQWPFDARKVIGGSSLIDILVYIETVIKGRRVFLDYRANPTAFSFDALGDEARQYLERSEALQERPIERLRKMNPGAIDLYRDHGIDIESEPLEIAVCAQHNNGGLAADHWWASTNIAHLFPVGEVNGSHGVARPGGSALNAGQVGGFRAAEYIANRCAESTLASENIEQEAGQAVADVLRWLDKSRSASRNWQTERDALQDRMSRAGAHIRSSIELESALSEAREQWKRLQETGCGFDDAAGEAAEALRTRFLCLAHLVYLDAVSFAVRSGVGSRGSAIVLDPAGKPIHEQLGKEWCIQVEDDAFRSRVLESRLQPDGTVQNRWVQRRPVPESDPWFETEWARFREGAIYDT